MHIDSQPEYPTPSRPLLLRGIGGLLTIIAVAAVVLASAPAAAQPEQPLKMTFVDATPNQSRAIYDKLRAIISNSDDIQFTKSSDFLYRAQQFDITLDTLGDTGSRTSQRELIRRSMRANDLESIVVYKRTGETLHLIVIGPTGSELRHFRSPIRQPRITDRQAIAVLKKIFEVLVPEVRSFRQQQSKLDQTRKTVDEQEELEQQTDDQLKDEVVKKHRESHGNLDQHVTLRLSPIFGRRQLNIATQGGFELGHATPFFGIGARIDAIFGLMSADTAGFGGTAFFDFAPFSTQFSAGGEKKQGTLFRGGAQLRYLAGVSKGLILFGQLGGQSLNIGIATNSTYVGSTYFAISGGPGLIYRISDVADLEIQANALPTVMTNTNDKSFGDGAFSFGFNGRGQFSLTVLDPLALSVYYDFTYLAPDHPEPRDYDSPASGSDTLHIGGVSLGYAF